MNINYAVVLTVAGVALAITVAAHGFTAKGAPVNVLRHVVKDIDGNDVNLAKYHGNVVLIVNVASKCGFTGQYAALEALYKKYRDQGLIILGFPANDFLRQEPGTDADIKSFCSLTYGVSFPMFSKVTVTGRKKVPLYKDLTEKATNPHYSGGVKWNFTKFLIGKDGTVIGRFSPNKKPDSKDIIDAIEEALAKKSEQVPEK